MLIRVFTTDDNGQTALAAEMEIDAAALIEMARPREAQARDMGQDWTGGAIPFFVQELVNALENSQAHEEIETQALNAAMTAWLYDSIYDGVTEEVFAGCDLVFTISPGGVVQYDRSPANAV